MSGAGARGFLDELTAATALVAQFEAGRLDFAAFAEAYASYHHAAALDGHEGSVPDGEGRFSRAIRLHADVQRLIDRVYRPVAGSPERTAWPADRIDVAEAEIALRDLSAAHDVANILRQLNTAWSEPR